MHVQYGINVGNFIVGSLVWLFLLTSCEEWVLQMSEFVIFHSQITVSLWIC